MFTVIRKGMMQMRHYHFPRTLGSQSYHEIQAEQLRTQHHFCSHLPAHCMNTHTKALSSKMENSYCIDEQASFKHEEEKKYIYKGKAMQYSCK